MPGSLRIVLTLFSTLILGTLLFPDYLGTSVHHPLPGFQKDGSYSLILVGMTALIELSLGYLIGFVFSLVFEAVLLAGQLLDFSMGLSLSEIFDPTASRPQGLMGQLLTLFSFLLLLSMDLHHLFFQVAAESFANLPIGQAQFSHEALQEITLGTGRLFHQGVQLAAVPLVVLTLVTIALGFMARILPEMNLFMVGLPIKLFIGFYCLIFTLHTFPPLLQRAFTEYYNLSTLLLRHLSTVN